MKQQNTDKEFWDDVKFVILLIAGIFLIAWLAGCSSAKKASHQLHTKDSSSVTTVNKLATVDTDSSANSSSRVITDGNTTIAFEDDDDDSVKVPGEDLIDARDYEPVKRTEVVFPGGLKVSTNQKIKNITSKLNQIVIDTNASRVWKRATDADNSTTAVQVSQKDEINDKRKFKINMTWLFVAAGICLFIFFAIRRAAKEFDENRN